jgi:hypothetical protein
MLEPVVADGRVRIAQRTTEVQDEDGWTERTNLGPGYSWSRLLVAPCRLASGCLVDIQAVAAVFPS